MAAGTPAPPKRRAGYARWVTAGSGAYAAIIIETGEDHGPTSPRGPDQRAK